MPEEDAKATSFSHYVKVTVPKQQNFLTRLCCQICFFSSKWLPCQWNTTINLRIDSIKDVNASRLFSYLILSWMIGKKNVNCKNILAFSFLDEFQGSSWNETLVHRFQEKFLNRQPLTLIIFLNVGRYSEKWRNSVVRYMTYVGEYYDREKKHYMACNYSLLVYSFINSKYFYCDPFGWIKPIILDSYMQELILLLKNEVVLVDIVECHYNDTKFRSCQV